jgi:hypothetical protein
VVPTPASPNRIVASTLGTLVIAGVLANGYFHEHRETNATLTARALPWIAGPSMVSSDRGEHASGSGAPVPLGVLIRPDSDRNTDGVMSRPQVAVHQRETLNARVGDTAAHHASGLVATATSTRVGGGGRHGVGGVSGADFGRPVDRGESSNTTTVVHDPNRTQTTPHNSAPRPAPPASSPAPRPPVAPAGTAAAAALPAAPFDSISAGLFGDDRTSVADLRNVASGTTLSAGPGGSTMVFSATRSGAAFAPGANAVSPTPEPASLLLIVSGGALLLGRVRRRTRQ